MFSFLKVATTVPSSLHVLNALYFLLELMNEVAVLIVQEVGLNWDEVDVVLTGGREIGAVENSHSIFLGGNYILALSFQLLKELEDIAEILAAISVVVIVMDNLEAGAELLQVLGEWARIGNTCYRAS